MEIKSPLEMLPDEELWHSESKKSPSSLNQEQAKELLHLQATIPTEAGDRPIDQDLFADLTTGNLDNPYILRTKMDEAPMALAFWGTVKNAAVLKRDLVKQDYEVWYAEKSRDARDELGKDRPVSYVISEQSVKNWIINYFRVEYLDWQFALSKANQLVENCEIYVKAWEKRTMLLPSIAKLSSSLMDMSGEGVRVYNENE